MKNLLSKFQELTGTFLKHKSMSKQILKLELVQIIQTYCVENKKVDYLKKRKRRPQSVKCRHLSTLLKFCFEYFVLNK